jgi:hypothetical protein
MLAMRAAAMAAGMRDKALMFAVVALRQHYRALRGAALLHGSQSFKLARSLSENKPLKRAHPI